MAIQKLNHYAIPKSCSGGNSCPVANVDLSGLMPKAWEGRYADLELGEGNRLRHDETGEYTPQGACTDGLYIYAAYVKEDSAATMIKKFDINTGALISQVTRNSFGHANDMTYRDGHLYIAHSSSTSTIYKVNCETLDLVETFNVASTIWGITYDETNDLFIVGNVGAAYLSVYYPDFSFMYRIKPQNAFTGLVRQGLSCDSNYIYINLDNAYGALKDDSAGSRIMVYTWNGMFIKSIYLNIKEIEWAFPHNGKMYIGTYEGRDANNVKSGDIYAAAYDLYPGQTIITGRPTDVSGGVNNLQRLPEGTPVRLWNGSATAGTITLDSKGTQLRVTEDAPFRYLRFRFRGANQNVFDWYPAINGVVTLREFDVTAAAEDSNVRFREARAVFNQDEQTFVIESNLIEEWKYDASEKALQVTKSPAVDPIEITQIWGIV